MERKQFLTTAAGVAATIAVARVALAEPTPFPMATRGPRRSDQNLARVRHHLEKAIDELQHDQHDYCGHRERSIDLLQRARAEIEAGLRCDQPH
ncbi:MAG: hypothetical protein ACR2KS_10835 [Candidatus Eremiobacter antarcticus]|nr:hypothetical protein [Candidatus Eremiobacteraeota bacterium]MBC5807553.1 hypothetical protein [Candidatus Eremiobacteraeota bacterium]